MRKRRGLSLWYCISMYGLLPGIKKWRTDRKLGKALDTLKDFSVFSNFRFENETLYTAVLEKHAMRPLLIADCEFIGSTPVYGKESAYLTVVSNCPVGSTLSETGK